MWFVPAILAGISAVGGALGNRSRKAKSYQYTNSKTDTGYLNQFNYFANQYSGVKYDPHLENLRNKLINTSMDMLGPMGGVTPKQFADAYTQQVISNANAQAQLANKIFANQMASRGLTASPMAAAAMARTAEGNRIQQILDALNNSILVERQAELEDFSRNLDRTRLATEIFQTIPKDVYSESWQGGDSWGSSTTTNVSESIGEQTIPGNVLGGIFSSLGSVLALLAGMGMFNKPQTAPQPISGSIMPNYSGNLYNRGYRLYPR